MATPVLPVPAPGEAQWLQTQNFAMFQHALVNHKIKIKMMANAKDYLLGALEATAISQCFAGNEYLSESPHQIMNRIEAGLRSATLSEEAVKQLKEQLSRPIGAEESVRSVFENHKRINAELERGARTHNATHKYQYLEIAFTIEPKLVENLQAARLHVVDPDDWDQLQAETERRVNITGRVKQRGSASAVAAEPSEGGEASATTGVTNDGKKHGGHEGPPQGGRGGRRQQGAGGGGRGSGPRTTPTVAPKADGFSVRMCDALELGWCWKCGYQVRGHATDQCNALGTPSCPREKVQATADNKMGGSTLVSARAKKHVVAMMGSS